MLFLGATGAGVGAALVLLEIDRWSLWRDVSIWPCAVAALVSLWIVASSFLVTSLARREDRLSVGQAAVALAYGGALLRQLLRADPQKFGLWQHVAWLSMIVTVTLVAVVWLWAAIRGGTARRIAGTASLYGFVSCALLFPYAPQNCNRGEPRCVAGVRAEAAPHRHSEQRAPSPYGAQASSTSRRAHKSNGPFL